MDKNLRLELHFTVHEKDCCCSLILDPHVLDCDPNELRNALHELGNATIDILAKNKDELKKRLEKENETSDNPPKS